MAGAQRLRAPGFCATVDIVAHPDVLDDLPALLMRLSLAEKASLTSGADPWHTRPVERLGIPSVRWAGEASGSTCFPSAAGLASSWNPALLHLVGDARGREARAGGVGVLLGPALDLPVTTGTDADLGAFAEDPVLGGELAAAFVAGVQRHGVGTSPAHDAGAGAGRGERAPSEIRLAVLERVMARARPWAVAAIGAPAAGEPWPLIRVLRVEWQFEGPVVCTPEAAGDPVQALRAGVDLQLPAEGARPDGSPEAAAGLVTAVRDGALDEAVLDAAVTRLLGLVRRAVRAEPAAGVSSGPVDLEVQHALARQVAHECAVLLKNEADGDRPLLPLSMAATGSLAVIGEFARTPWFAPAGPRRPRPVRLEDALSELRQLAGPALRIQFAPGFLVGSGAAAPVAPDHHSAAELRAQAVDVARQSDVALLFLGAARGCPELPRDQLELLRAVAEVNPRLAVVLTKDSPLSVGEWDQHARAVLECGLLGQAGGGATADLIFGLVSPSAKLADATGDEAPYPFGHGLSYTTFGYDDLALRVGPDGASVDVGFTVTNTGRRLGQEVAQIYLAAGGTPLTCPRRELKAFAKVDLHPGESSRVERTLSGRELSFFDERAGGRLPAGGEVVVEVGASSRDLRLTGRVELVAEVVTLPSTGGSTPKRGVEHPVGGPVRTAPSAG